ncbi:ligase-associated DNA damage response endonuclease PdeM [Lacibacter luteus]|uniref:Ligase-associated DNA damage response endonuclease PdeM n=1 Tax=Lacibacter luteus TaxID=2508719 RepID=A0A4Q1CE38_9BACT|nr:ligase-associated DNA damage response endonuclease PdeM [Lacibacter luteus]RXK57818.1 ligase-associated DNA damage response endonuclease PdeM [Lacibacter luteus]
MQQPTYFQHFNQTLWLSPERCIFWEEERWLIVSDIHFGKSGHFRKAGIGIPQTVFKEDLHRLVTQIQFFKPAQLIVVGDFFHSHINNEIKLFEKWRNDLASLPIHLVKGNHDILEPNWYDANTIVVHETQLVNGPFAFMHELPEEATTTGQYIFTGHIHPGIHIAGLGKQSLRFPCFYFGEQHAVLPAFGRFTGLHAVRPKKKDKIFAIAEQRLVELQ